MKVLTFNWHEAYLCSLAKTGYMFEIVEREKGGSRLWFYETRPLPSNALIVKETTARRRARERAYDVVICHNFQDLLWSREYSIPKVLVFHNMLSTEIALGGNVVNVDTYRSEARALLQATSGVTPVFISETKRADWDLDGHVITPGIDPDDYSGYDGQDQRVLRVGNFIKRRDVMLGHAAQLAILKGQPSTLLGLNDPEDGGRFTRSWEDLKTCYRSHRVYLNTTVDGYEDGYNLAMLEAMATGMPVVSTANRTSPIVDGNNGFVSDDLELLSSRIAELMGDHALAVRLGQEARRIVERSFHIRDFAAKWRRLLDNCVAGRPAAIVPNGVAVCERGRIDRKKILLAYVSYPATTARYIEASLRKRHDVITIGPAIGEDLKRLWKLENMNEPVVPHDLPCGPRVDIETIVARLPKSWKPDLFLWIESVAGYRPEGVVRLDCPKACYLIDSHLNLAQHLEWAWRFDWVFVAHRQYVRRLQAAGCERVCWLPVACDPGIHERMPHEKLYDIGFVGSLNQERRKALLARLASKFHVHVERSFLRDMARTFCQSKIVFNNAVKDDLNMRVFEALSCGSFLLTDRAPGSGLDEMFIDRKHLAIYDDGNLEDLSAYYLAHDEEREAVAAQGRTEVLRWHTYDHRAATLLDTIFGDADPADSLDLMHVEDPGVRELQSAIDQRLAEPLLSGLENCRTGRELTATERFVRDCVDARLRQQQGSHTQARQCLIEAVRNLPQTDRQVFLSLMSE